MSERERFDELESALNAVFSGRDMPNDVGDEPRDLARLAGYLLGLPREEFRASLKADLVRPAGASPQAEGKTAEGEAETAMVPLAWIVEAKLVLTDQLMKRGAEERAARLAAESQSGEHQPQTTE